MTKIYQSQRYARIPGTSGMRIESRDCIQVIAFKAIDYNRVARIALDAKFTCSYENQSSYDILMTGRGKKATDGSDRARWLRIFSVRRLATGCAHGERKNEEKGEENRKIKATRVGERKGEKAGKVIENATMRWGGREKCDIGRASAAMKINRKKNMPNPRVAYLGQARWRSTFSDPWPHVPTRVSNFFFPRETPAGRNVQWNDIFLWQGWFNFVDWYLSQIAKTIYESRLADGIRWTTEAFLFGDLYICSWQMQPYFLIWIRWRF